MIKNRTRSTSALITKQAQDVSFGEIPSTLTQEVSPPRITKHSGRSKASKREKKTKPAGGRKTISRRAPVEDEPEVSMIDTSSKPVKRSKRAKLSLNNPEPEVLIDDTFTDTQPTVVCKDQSDDDLDSQIQSLESVISILENFKGNVLRRRERKLIEKERIARIAYREHN